jgi:hypothetical protein
MTFVVQKPVSGWYAGASASNLTMTPTPRARLLGELSQDILGKNGLSSNLMVMETK